MKKYLIGLIVVLLCLTGCMSTATNTQAYDYMNTVEVVGDAGVWVVKEYVDDFKNPTGEKYIRTTCSGLFTNSATNGSDLTAQVIVEANNAQIRLLEYGDNPTSVIGDPSINVKINYDGQTVNLTGVWYAKSVKRVVINDPLPLFQALVEHEKVSMYISIGDYGKSTYLFDIYSDGFVYNYKEAFLK